MFCRKQGRVGVPGESHGREDVYKRKGKNPRNQQPAEKGPLGSAAMASLCELFDPEGQMNPGKLLPDND